jgi:cobyrinic acid a,c-diamide synthase
MSTQQLPRLVIAGVHSGSGKTTFTCAILAALRQRGLRVAAFKAGPDYIDPTYLRLAAGAACRNLDTWMLPPDVVRLLFRRAAADAGLGIVEGVMGLYDGRGAGGASDEGEDEGSTAHLAKLLDAPVLLVVDAAASSRTAAAVVLGCQQFDPQVRLAGVLLSGIASPRHLELVAGPITRATGLPVLGYLPRRPEFSLPERHLGLIPALEQGADEAFFTRLAAQAAETIDLDRVLAIAQDAPPFPASEPPATLLSAAGPDGARERVRIALALDDAFHFYYEDGLDLLRDSGAELVPFSPLRDEALPDGVQGIYLGGGFPEVFASELSANYALHSAIRAAVHRGLPIYAECGGLMYLGRGIIDEHGRRYPMASILPCWSVMGQPRVTLGYRVARARRASLLLPAGKTVRGHEFHWSVLDRAVDAAAAAYDLESASGQPAGVEGYVAGPRDNVLASYVHLHFGADPTLAPAFVRACQSAPLLAAG